MCMICLFMVFLINLHFDIKKKRLHNQLTIAKLKQNQNIQNIENMTNNKNDTNIELYSMKKVPSYSVNTVQSYDVRKIPSNTFDDISEESEEESEEENNDLG